MKVAASVKKMCRNCKVIRRKGVVRVICTDPRPRQVVRRELDRHLVARQDPDVVHPHLSRDVPEHDMAVLELDAKRGVGEILENLALHLNDIVFRHAFRVGVLVRSS